MKVAALDLGSNTFLCLIAEVENGIVKQVLSDQVEIVRLGQGLGLKSPASSSNPLTQKRFHPEALERARMCLQSFSKTIDSFEVRHVLAVATAAARNVANADELISICKNFSLPLEIISGEKEAELTFSGGVSGLPDDDVLRLLIDIGGGSTELILGRGHKLIRAFSVQIGSVQLTEKFISAQPISEEQYLNLKNEIETKTQLALDQVLRGGGYRELPQEVWAVAGTPTELARAELGHFDPAKIDGFQISSDKLIDWIRQFKSRGIPEIISDLGINKGRADVILAGASILNEICRQSGATKFFVSTRGVRFGVALDIEKERRAR